MLEGISLTFNVDVAALQELGLDPTTSEGKLELRTFVVQALNNANIGEGMAYEGRDAAIVKLLLGEEGI